jgi:hypothetical protein
MFGKSRNWSRFSGKLDRAMNSGEILDYATPLKRKPPRMRFIRLSATASIVMSGIVINDVARDPFAHDKVFQVICAILMLVGGSVMLWARPRKQVKNSN